MATKRAILAIAMKMSENISLRSCGLERERAARQKATNWEVLLLTQSGLSSAESCRAIAKLAELAGLAAVAVEQRAEMAELAGESRPLLAGISPASVQKGPTWQMGSLGE